MTFYYLIEYSIAFYFGNMIFCFLISIDIHFLLHC